MIEVGQTIGNYKITAKLGEGGMGIVYLAEHPVIGKKVAMKAIHPELSRNAEVVSRFMTEAKSVNQIGNEHIVDITDFGNTADGEFYFIMEFLQGESLADRLKRERILPPTRALQIGAQVADALAASHEHGIIHRDLKPENIYLIGRGQSKDFVKVLDFGLAKLTQGDEKVSHKTRTGSVMGTPYYMAPEQCEGKPNIDHRADVYSLGIILFEMLTGKVPFGGEGYGEIIVKHITMPPPSPRSINPAVPESLEQIVFRALAKNRDQRFQDMGELRAAMLDPEGYLAGAPRVAMPDDATGGMVGAMPVSRADVSGSGQVGFGSGIQPPGGQTPMPSTLRSGMGEVVDEFEPKKSNRGVIIGVVAAAVLGGGAAVFFVGGAGKETKPVPVVQTAPPKAPTSVRINLGSDPEGAKVMRADTGKELGTTPATVDMLFSETDRIELVFKFTGYEDKKLTVMPNMGQSLNAQMNKKGAPPAATAAPSSTPTPVSTGPKRDRPKRDRPSGGNKSGKPIDDDAVLEPSFK